MATVLPVYPRTRRGAELVLVLLALAISTGAWAVVGLTADGALPPNMLVHAGVLGGLAVGLHLVLRWRAKYADPVLLPVATLLNGLGLVMIHRLDGATSGAAQAPRQFVWSALGVLAAAAVLVLVRDHRVLRRYTFTAMVAGLVLLLLPLLPVLGREINGARIWVGIGPLSFQPGEIAKIVLAVFFAGYLVVHRDALSLTGPKLLFLRLPRARDLGPILLAWLASVGVLVLQRDLGTSLLFFGLFVAVLYVATERVSWIVLGLGLFAAGAVFAASAFSHVQQRVDIWLHPFDPDNTDRSYQLVQGLYGMANGGLTGTGLDRGRPDIVPFANSDFIYSSFGEELGLVGLFAVLLLYAVLVQRGLRSAIGVRDGFGKLLAAGLSFSVALQVFVVVGGVTRVIPLTGLTMPFLAAGGSSLVSNWIVVALLLRVSDLARRPAEEVRNGPEAGDTGVTQVVRLG
ncbi:FtsW/RodA/SpoVE family cell cycle protein [Kineococcus sp. SYSU DK004]|uniref:FtsW/RodA/SpoVE family cell cycle protein n=1 Tax=Kineococcus sp. SYSU DK004 TaxID=3383125 RepID=UPI003D7CF569